MKILFIDRVHASLNSMLSQEGHHCVEAYHESREAIMEMLPEFEGIVLRSRILIDRDLLDLAVNLKFIARAGAGMESIDVEAAKERKVLCLNAPEGNRNAVAEHAMGMLLALNNNLIRADREVRRGLWKREENRGRELKGKTVGLIGFGNTGQAFAKKLSGFECKVIAFDKYRTGFGSDLVKEVKLEEIFLESDILSLHIPLTEETRYLVNEDFISRFRKSFLLINTSRGPCVDTKAFVNAMIAGKIGGACLDVLEFEDPSFEKVGSSDQDFRKSESWKFMLASDRVILSPHIAGWTFESHEKISAVLFEKIKALGL